MPAAESLRRAAGAHLPLPGLVLLLPALFLALLAQAPADSAARRAERRERAEKTPALVVEVLPAELRVAGDETAEGSGTEEPSENEDG